MDNDYQFQTEPLTEEEEQYLKDHADMSNDDKLQDRIFVPGTWQYELAEKILPDAEALCKNFARK